MSHYIRVFCVVFFLASCVSKRVVREAGWGCSLNNQDVETRTIHNLRFVSGKCTRLLYLGEDLTSMCMGAVMVYNTKNSQDGKTHTAILFKADYPQKGIVGFNSYPRRDAALIERPFDFKLQGVTRRDESKAATLGSPREMDFNGAMVRGEPALGQCKTSKKEKTLLCKGVLEAGRIVEAELHYDTIENCDKN